MSELVEVAFERVSHSNVNDLLRRFIGNSDNVLNGNMVGDLLFKEFDFFVNEIFEFSRLDGYSKMMLNLKLLKLPTLKIPSVNLFVIKDESEFYVEFNFEESDVFFNSCFIKSLNDDLSVYAEQYGIKTWYAGLDPASDENTRYFTGRNFGPVLLK